MEPMIKEKISMLFQGISSNLSATDPEWVEIVTAFSLKEVPASSRLTEREQMLCILSVLLGCQGMGEYRHMLRVALNKGLEPVAIKETVYQATAYLGIGRVHDFLETTNLIMAQFGISLPLPAQGATHLDSRFEKGLAKQVELFGADMVKRQTDCPPLRRNINRWLVNNCFGDYYTRNGLNNSEREMITFCFLLAQGGCENQLRRHTAGNIGVGNGKEKLYSVVEQCLPYIGYPRSLNAMNIIDEVAKSFENE